MNPKRTCPDCGSILPDDAPRELCPQCLMGAALSADATDATGQYEPARPSVLDTIAQSIGPVPRVLLRDTGPGEMPGPIVRPDASGGGSSIRYRIDGEIARGGMGAVFKGRDPDLGREVALKVLREDYREDATMVRRFVEEAQIGGQLQHPGVVPIYELGTMADRRPFFSMKLVKGHTLAQLLDQRSGAPADLPRYLSIFEAICQTVAYAHARGVIHRDLKPSNVMVGSFGEVQVMDWGLAKVLPRGGVVDDASAGKTRTETVIATARSGSSDSDLSRIGSVMGTPAYMAPEQARGEVNQLDERADVFSLGSILTEILTGQPAFVGRSSGEIQRKATLGDTADALARLGGCGADPELITLAKDCLAREREDRQRDASAVADRMTAYLASVQERVQAAERERAVAVSRAVEERRRRKVQLALAGSVLAFTVLSGLSATYYFDQRAESERKRVAQDAATERVVGQAATLLEQAQANLEEISRWQAALAAVKQAEAASDEGARPRLLVLKDQIKDGLDAARRDQALLDRLVEIRSAEADDLTGSITDKAYAEAFGDAGIDPATLTPADAAAKIKARPPSLALGMTAALDDWAAIRRGKLKNQAGAARLGEVARIADPDAWRNGLRAALAEADKATRLAALEAVAKTAKFDELGPISLQLLGTALNNAGGSALAESILRKAQQWHPRDVWVNHELAKVLLGLKRRDEAIRFFSTARAIRPETAHELAHALADRGDIDEAIAVFRELIALRPDMHRHPDCLGATIMLNDHQDKIASALQQAVPAFREAVRLKPEDAAAHCMLAMALTRQGKPAEAMAEFRVVQRLDPERRVAWKLATIDDGPTASQGYLMARLTEVIAELTGRLGDSMRLEGKLDEAMAAYREAIRLDPNFAPARLCLGAILCDVKHDYAAAEAEFREAIRLLPHEAAAHLNLGTALGGQGKVSEAIAAYREAIRHQPDIAEAHSNLGLALRQQGQYAAALDALRKGHALGSKRPGWPYPSAEWVRDAERLAALAERLPAILRGDDRPKDNAGRLAVAQACYDTKRHAAAARFWAEALAAEPKLADDRRAQHRYNAACAAALAGSGQGTDDPKPDDAARATLRGQALDWLKAERAAWAKVLDSGDAQARSGAAQMLRHWQADPDLAGVRDRDAIEKLLADERRAWEAIWKDVDTLLKGVSRPGPTAREPGGAAPVRQGGAPAESKLAAPPRDSLGPATPKPVDAAALEDIHKRAHELAPSKPAEAEPLFRQALEGYRKIQGQDGALTLDLTLDLANVLEQTGRGPEAESLFRVGLERARKRFGPADPRTAGVMAMLDLSLVQHSKWT
jgi:eukaryotic-like serine/threonine-protein kinase